MGKGRLSDRTISKTRKQSRSWLLRLRHQMHQRLVHNSNSSTATLLYSAQHFFSRHQDHSLMLQRSNRISLTDFSFNFGGFSDSDCLHHFRFYKSDLLKVIRAVGWPDVRTRTTRNRYSTDPALACCVVLRRLSNPVRWYDMELLFGKHGPQLSEIFWETLENFLHLGLSVLQTGIEQQWFQDRLAEYASAVHRKTGALDNCVGFIDGTVSGIARPSDYMWQLVTYNGHKKKHAIKFQTISLPHGLTAHVFGPVEGRRHDWTLYVRSEMDTILANNLNHNGTQYCVYDESGYNDRVYLFTPAQGSNLSQAESFYNRGMSWGRVTVEWIFKEVKIYWPVTDFKRKMRVLESPVGSMYLAAMLLTNVRNCIYPNTVSQYFKLKPPSFEEYMGI